MRRFRVYVKPLERMLEFDDDADDDEIGDVVDDCIEDLLDSALIKMAEHGCKP